MKYVLKICCLMFVLGMMSCVDDLNEENTSYINDNGNQNNNGDQGNSGNNNDVPVSELEDQIIAQYFGENIDLNDLQNYEDQITPNYINRDNIRGNDISDIGATLGRILFYDTNLSSINTISCASCHQQENAFGDIKLRSQGINGQTGRHSMRLINARFSDEIRFFWDERAGDLEEQTTMPIQDHIEMGFSGTEGDLDIDDLINRLNNIDFYQILFNRTYGSPIATELRMQNALAQFIRSIQSFDSKYDVGRTQVNNRRDPFTNFTAQENQGKRLFVDGRNQGGANCATCHEGDEFSIDRNTDNNGVIGTIGSNDLTLTVTKSPTLRDMFNPSGELNGPLMHNGIFENMEGVINHYNNIDFDPNVNPNLDPRLRIGGPGGPEGPGNGNGTGQNLNLDQQERVAIIAFLRTLSGNDVYVNEKWSNPFME